MDRWTGNNALCGLPGDDHIITDKARSLGNFCETCSIAALGFI